MPETSDVKAALERLRNAWDRYANGYDIGIKHPSEAIEAHIASQQAEIERLRGLLREHEWCWIGNYDSATVCAHCLSDMADGHAPGCPMAAALAREAKP